MERKWFPFTLTKSDPDTGSFEGYASTFGNVDEHGDVVIPGAFDDTLPQFLSRGFFTDAHLTDEPIGYPTAAHEDPKGLFVAGRFHGTARAQTVRTFSRERVAAGKEMGLSIGYLVPPGGAHKRSDGIRELHKIELVEVALTIMPANVEALVTGVKHRATPDPLTFERQRWAFLERYHQGAFADRAIDRRELAAIKANAAATVRRLAS